MSELQGMVIEGPVPGAPPASPGDMPPSEPAFIIDARDGEARFRALREGALAKTLLGPDCFARFWFGDLRRLSLFLTVMGETAWLGGSLGSFQLGLLAQRSRMSGVRVAQLIDIAVSTGDFTRHRDPRDARLLVLEPAAASCEALERLVARFSASAAAFLGCSDPVPGLTEAQRLQACRLFTEATLDLLRDLNMEDRATGSLAFFLVLLDLRLHSPVAAADFVRREALRLRLTKVTIRNILRRTGADGWTQRRGRLVQLTGPALARIDAGLRDIEARLAALHAAIAALPHGP